MVVVEDCWLVEVEGPFGLGLRRSRVEGPVGNLQVTTGIGRLIGALVTTGINQGPERPLHLVWSKNGLKKFFWS